MDCETTIECYRELIDDGPYREEAIDLLIPEINSSPLLADSEKAELFIVLDEIRKERSFGEAPVLKRFWSILVRNEMFACEILSWRMLGKSWFR
jgi:hypothetical protein